MRLPYAHGAMAALAIHLLIACVDTTDPVAEPARMLDAELVTSARDELTTSSITICGLSCPGGYHPTGYSRSIACGIGSTGDNQVTCEPNAGTSFVSCGLSCPGGYHPTGYSRTIPCGIASTGNNTVSCEIDAGAQFGSCGLSCPAGYVAIAFSRVLACGIASTGNNHVTCQRLLSGDVWTSPSTITLPAGQTGSTTVGWSTSQAQQVEVRAQPPGQGERTIAFGTSGSVGYGPIGAGETHTLRLYGNGVLLDTATVTAVAQTGSISAAPETVIVTGSVGSTTIRWSSQGVGNVARVFVSVDGAAPTVFAGGASGSAVASWIQADHTYRFSLRAGTTAAAPELAAVRVVGQGQAPAIDPIGGSWWNPARSGNGFDLRVAGDQLIVYWLTYDAAGTPVWYLGALSRQPGRWSGDLSRYTWNGGSASATPVGSATITLSAPDRGQIAWTLGGASGTEPIERLIFGGGASPVSLSGLWYWPSQGGWGLNVETQGDTHVAYLLAYTGSGAPTWVMGVASGAGVASFGLSRITGTNLCPGCTGPTSTTSAPAGSMAMDTSRAGSGVATTTIDAVLAGGVWQRFGVELARLL